MLHAAQAPVTKLVAVGGAALALMIGATLPSHHPTHHRSHHRLSLDAPVEPTAIYLSAFASGDIAIARDDSAPLKPIRFSMRALIPDGCTWLGVEELVPLDAKHYSYSYNETIESCPPDADPWVKTPRTGLVTVED